jgi:hypothetical protein
MFFQDHNPAHFHIKYQEFEASINIEDGIVKGELPRRALNLIYEWLDLHKSELLENRKLLELRKPINKIESLK